MSSVPNQNMEFGGMALSGTMTSMPLTLTLFSTTMSGGTRPAESGEKGVTSGAKTATRASRSRTPSAILDITGRLRRPWNRRPGSASLVRDSADSIRCS